jgi:hypothetical protein
LLIFSELKAIKDAGFQEHTEVLVHFEPIRATPPKVGHCVADVVFEQPMIFNITRATVLSASFYNSAIAASQDWKFSFCDSDQKRCMRTACESFLQLRFYALMK